MCLRLHLCSDTDYLLTMDKLFHLGSSFVNEVHDFKHKGLG